MGRISITKYKKALGLKASMRIETRRTLIATGILVILYVLLGNARSIEENLFIPGATIAVSMIVPVVGGVLFGKRVGFAVGILGTLANSLSPAGSIFTYLAILPHGIMGFTAGYLQERIGPPIPALSIMVGHFLNIFAYISFGLIPMGTISDSTFWLGLGYETVIGVMTIALIVAIYRMGFEDWL